MKKIIPILSILMLLSLTNQKEEVVMIPKEAIRFRVIANSDSTEDQRVKRTVKRGIQQELYESVKNASSIEEARKITKGKLGEYQEKVETILKEEDQQDTEVKLNYGQNYFPEKEYKNVIYEAGEYESLVITLGEGKGKNFWCVLFPPLCMIDEENDIEYKSLIKEVLDRYF